jgi:hypothetical protein
VTIIFTAIGLFLKSVSLLMVILPIPFISSTITVNINTVTVDLVVFPFTCVDVPINMLKFSRTCCSIIYSLTCIYGAIRPDLHSITLTEIASLLTIIHNASHECYCWPPFDFIKSCYKQLHMYRWSGGDKIFWSFFMIICGFEVLFDGTRLAA